MILSEGVTSYLVLLVNNRLSEVNEEVCLHMWRSSQDGRVTTLHFAACLKFDSSLGKLFV